MAKKKTPPAPTVEKIRELEKQYGDFYSALKGKGGEPGGQQALDQQYYDDEFPVAIKKPYHIKRTGSAARIVDIACESIDTSNPVVFCKPRKNTGKEIERANKRAKLLNYWVPQWREEIEEAKRNLMHRGEAFFQIEYNDNHDPNNEDSLPVFPIAPEPMIIYPDPYEYAGIPRKVIKSCYMNAGQVEQMFPSWSNPDKKTPNAQKGVKYLAYWDTGHRYLEADKEELFGSGPNIFGLVPFIHCYSGFGKRSPEGKPETKIVGRLRKNRSTLIAECEMASRIDSQIGLYTDPVLLFRKIARDADEPPDEDSVVFKPGAVIVAPYGWEYEIYQGQIPGPQMYQYYYQIQGRLGLETPPVAMGLPSTSRATGRQEDIYAEQYSRQYRTLKKNFEVALARALSMALKILDTVPGSLPITIRATSTKDGKDIREEEKVTKEDIDGYYDCHVEFRAADELVEDRKVMLGRMLVSEGRIDWRSFLIDFCGYSQEKAEETINQTIADQVIFSPQLMGIVAQEALEKAGMGRFLKEMEAQAGREAEMAQTPPAQAPPTPATPRPSEARNPMAREITRQVLEQTPVGVRRPPR